ncbi:transposase [Aquicoccus sp.]|uniref:transposase n=1 Tax=Aquicoccus sp. TaxID=2055851 RepID=UPI003561B571
MSRISWGQVIEKRIGPWVGLTPSRNQSGERDVSGGTTKVGDVNLRRALGQAEIVMMSCGRSNWLRAWGTQFAQRRHTPSDLGRWHGPRSKRCATNA